MNAFSPERDFRKEIVGLGAAAFLMAISVSYIPALGLIFASLSPVPLIILFYLLGRKSGLLVVSVIFGAISLFSGTTFGALFILQYGVMGLVIGEATRLNCKVARILSLGAIIPPLFWVIVFWLFLAGSGSSFTSVVESVIQLNIENAIQVYKEAGLGTEQLELLQRESSGLTWLITGSLPSFLLIGSFMSALINYSIARVVVRKRYGVEWRQVPPVKNCLIPDFLVWGLIFGTSLLLVSGGILRLAGLNIVIIMLTLYCVQGFAVISFLLEKWAILRGVKVFIYVILFIQPLSMVVVTILGLFDIWLDLRKFRVRTEVC